jgi:hypothetical protein
MRPMQIADGRAADVSLDRNGFELIEHTTAVTNFFDPDALEAVYHPEVERIIGGTTSRVCVATRRWS